MDNLAQWIGGCIIIAGPLGLCIAVIAGVIGGLVFLLGPHLTPAQICRLEKINDGDIERLKKLP